jgi:GntR family transcriptional regulator/MocR family aminotransferase
MRPSRASVLSLEHESDEPLYKQLFDKIVFQIRSGAFPPNHRLPPTRDLALELEVHRNTVVRAYEELEASGFVNSTVGRGTFVAQLSPDMVRDQAAKLSNVSAINWRSLASRAALAEPLSRVERLAPPSADVIHLSRLQPSADLLPHELMRRSIDHVLKHAGAKTLAYSPPEGLPRLRQLISEDLGREGVPAAMEDIVITTGSQQALDVLARSLINPGEPFLIDASTYTGAVNLLSVVGAKLISVPVDDDGPDLASLSRLERSGAKGYYLMPNCHNPTGASISRDRREALVDWSLRSGIPLIEDDYGEGLSLDDEPSPPALRAFTPDVIYMGTFSKKLIPALRIGFLVCPKPLRSLLVPLKHAMDLGTSSLLQHALAEFLDRGYLRAHIKKTVPEYRKRRDALEGALRKYMPRGIEWRHPTNGVVLWLRFPPSLDPLRLYEEGLRAGVVVSPTTLNTADGRPVSGVRLTFCSEPPDRLIEGAKRLGRALHTMMASSTTERAPEALTAIGAV